jgi:hypothetical protein
MNQTSTTLSAIIFFNQLGQILLIELEKEQKLLKLPEMSLGLIENPDAVEGLLFSQASDATLIERNPTFFKSVRILRKNEPMQIAVFTAKVKSRKYGQWSFPSGIDHGLTCTLLDAILPEIYGYRVAV